MKGVLLAVSLLCPLCALLTGCGGSSLNTVKVTGKVTVAGQPVKDITVSFVPEAGGRPATGVTDASGNFTLSTLSAGDGAIPGKNKVGFGVVSSGEPPSSDPSAPTTTTTLPFNVKYTNAETSGITVDVVAGKANELPPWDLEK